MVEMVDMAKTGTAARRAVRLRLDAATMKTVVAEAQKLGMLDARYLMADVAVVTQIVATEFGERTSLPGRSMARWLDQLVGRA